MKNCDDVGSMDEAVALTRLTACRDRAGLVVPRSMFSHLTVFIDSFTALDNFQAGKR